VKRRLVVCALLAACGGSSSSSQSSAGSRVGPALAAVLEAAAQTKAPWRCAAADGAEAAAETIEVGKRAWKIGGHAMKLEGTGAIEIGVIADAGGSGAATLAAIGRLRGAIGPVDLVIALGGMGATQAELEATLAALEPAKAAVLAIPGDLEPAQAHGAAVAALRAKKLAVVDGRLVHRVAVPGADLAILAGAGSELRLAAGADGCGYREHDATVAFADLAKGAGLRILASPEGPRRMVDGDPTGELALVPPAGTVDLVLHGPTGEPVSAGRSGKRDGEAVALTPGTSDAGPRVPVHRPPTAGILSITAQGWTWRPVGDAP
jgi:hypothetical protein